MTVGPQLAFSKRSSRLIGRTRSALTSRSGCVLAWLFGDVQSVVVEPYRIEVPDGELDRLRLRLANARWPDRETVEDWSQGVPLEIVRDLCDYWRSGYDWRAAEQRLNHRPQYLTVLNGVPIHVFHLQSPSQSAVPLILTHGWPGSFFEFEQVMAQLSDPAASGEPKSPAFHVVVPSLPGYGFSGKPTTGWDVHRIARAWVEVMGRLGYDRFIAAGSDWGTSVSTSIAIHEPERLLGLHLVPPLVPAVPADGTALTGPERAALAELEERSRTASAYSAVHQTRPQTIGYSLVDSPVGLCAWILEKIWTWSDHDGDLYSVLSRDQVLDDVTLYWLTGTGASSVRLYWESIEQVSRWFTDSIEDTIAVPTGCTVFPCEVPRPSRRLAERRFTNIVYWGEPERGGHFGAWEQPDRFVTEVRAAATAMQPGSTQVSG
jgi:epoxide hydrolase